MAMSGPIAPYCGSVTTAGRRSSGQRLRTKFTRSQISDSSATCVLKGGIVEAGTVADAAKDEPRVCAIQPHAGIGQVGRVGNHLDERLAVGAVAVSAPEEEVESLATRGRRLGVWDRILESPGRLLREQRSVRTQLGRRRPCGRSMGAAGGAPEEQNRETEPAAGGASVWPELHAADYCQDVRPVSSRPASSGISR